MYNVVYDSTSHFKRLLPIILHESLVMSLNRGKLIHFLQCFPCWQITDILHMSTMLNSPKSFDCGMVKCVSL